jgi:ketohexokinase
VEEFTADELVQAISEIPRVEDMKWVHFEGRIPEILKAAIPRIREIIPRGLFSLEIEKPDRHQLLDLIPFIDFVFFSHTFYAHSGYDTPSAFFSAMRERTKTGTFVLTAGADGAYFSGPGIQFHVPTTEVRVVDATGAGDTFIAGYIWSSMKLGNAPLERMKSAVALATKKVAQEGFDNLWSLLSSTDFP